MTYGFDATIQGLGLPAHFLDIPHSKTVNCFDGRLINGTLLFKTKHIAHKECVSILLKSVKP